MLTPVRNPTTRGEERYSSRHKRARSVVEQAFGLLKMWFLSLHKFGGCLVYSPERAIRIITACFILHNLCVEHNIPSNDEDDVQQDEEENEVGNREDDRIEGQMVRDE